MKIVVNTFNLNGASDLIHHSKECLKILETTSTLIICKDGTDKSTWIAEAKELIKNLEDIINKKTSTENMIDNLNSVLKTCDIVNKLNLINEWVLSMPLK